jgi:hypothetical protein
LSPESIRDVFLASWCNREEQETIVYRNGQQREEALARGIALLDSYLDEPSPANILAVERPLIAPLVDRDGHYLERPLIAVPDLILRDHAGLRVIDFKATARSISASEVQTSLQATCYIHAARAVYGVPVGFEFAALLKTKIPRIQRVETSRTDADSNRLGELVASVERAIAADVFHAIESPINCTCCPFRRPCREWSMESGWPFVSPRAEAVGALPHPPSGTAILAQ